MPGIHTGVGSIHPFAVQAVAGTPLEGGFNPVDLSCVFIGNQVATAWTIAWTTGAACVVSLTDGKGAAITTVDIAVQGGANDMGDAAVAAWNANPVARQWGYITKLTDSSISITGLVIRGNPRDFTLAATGTGTPTRTATASNGTPMTPGDLVVVRPLRSFAGQGVVPATLDAESPMWALGCTPLDGGLYTPAAGRYDATVTFAANKTYGVAVDVYELGADSAPARHVVHVPANTSDNQTATDIATAVDALAGVTATATTNVVGIVPAAPGLQVAISVYLVDGVAGGAAISGAWAEASTDVFGGADGQIGVVVRRLDREGKAMGDNTLELNPGDTVNVRVRGVIVVPKPAGAIADQVWLATDGSSKGGLAYSAADATEYIPVPPSRLRPMGEHNNLLAIQVG